MCNPWVTFQYLQGSVCFLFRRLLVMGWRGVWIFVYSTTCSQWPFQSSARELFWNIRWEKPSKHWLRTFASLDYLLPLGLSPPSASSLNLIILTLRRWVSTLGQMLWLVLWDANMDDLLKRKFNTGFFKFTVLPWYLPALQLNNKPGRPR